MTTRKRRLLYALLMVETTALCLLVLLNIFSAEPAHGRKEIFRENSPDGCFTLVIARIGEPTWPFGPDHVQVTLFAVADYARRTSFGANIANDGGHGVCEVSWSSQCATITLRGREQVDAVYLLPFPTA